MKESDKQKPFHFKQFSLFHHRSTMKVGTDAVLLSAWIEPGDVKTILDVGTGSGIIALMMASRTNAKVDAIDIDPDSCKEAGQNFSDSPFNKRLRIFNQGFTIFTSQSDRTYDLVVSNPPFFINDMKSENHRKNKARHTDTLSYKELCYGAAQLLNSNGRLAIVLPYTESRYFIETATQHNLFLHKKLLIFPKPCFQPNRVNLEFCKEKPAKIKEEKFIIRQESGNFTQQYVDLLGKYYLSINKQ